MKLVLPVTMGYPAIANKRQLDNVLLDKYSSVAPAGVVVNPGAGRTMASRL